MADLNSTSCTRVRTALRLSKPLILPEAIEEDVARLRRSALGVRVHARYDGIKIPNPRYSAAELAFW